MNKKIVMATSFCLGAMMLVTTAFADIASKSGYEQLKDSIKKTFKSASGEFSNYTLEAVYSIKHNGKVIFTESESKKYDSTKNMEESLSTSENADGKISKNYYYNDSKQSIYHQTESDTYRVIEYTGERKLGTVENPFEDNKAKDIEMIFDAVVGNLKDYVVAEEKPDGTKEFSGSLSEVQIPTLVNAVTSFAFKQQFTGGYRSEENRMFPDLNDNIAVKNINGKATVNKDGIMERISGSVSMTGEDKAGTLHELVFEFSAGMMDVGKTVVNTPDLTGKKVEKSTQRSYDEKIVPKKFIGEYKNDIVIEKNDGFVKIGERTVKIVSIDDKHVSGSYSETIKPEFSDYAKNAQQFTFDAEINGPYNAEFTYKNASGSEEKGMIYFDMSGRIHFNKSFKGDSELYNSEFSRVFAD